MNISEPALCKLKCARCHLYLSIGPVTTNSHDFFCGRCPSAATVVKVYEVLAENFLFPCRYSGFGCLETIKWGLVQQHEQQCIKKPHLCPIGPTGVCLWRGVTNDIPQHFEQSHAEHVCDVHVIEIKLHEKLQENLQECMLIKYKGMYLFDVRFNKSQKVLKVNLTHLNSGKANEGTYQLKLHSSNFSKHLTLPVHQLQYYEADHGTKDENVIDVDVLKFLTSESESSTIFCEVVLGTQKTEVNDEFLKLLECPVCNDYMTSPILQCRTGHSFCGACTPKLKDCPLCHSVLTATRNYALEDLSSQLYGSCKNKDAGCTFKGLPDEVEKHEENCNIYTCPLKSVQNCEWRGDYAALVAHCASNHIYLDSASYGLLCNLSFDRYGIFRLIHYDGVFFRVCRKTENEEFCVVIQFVGPAKQADNYLYQFSFVSLNNNYTELVLKDACHVLTNDDEVFNNSFRIPFSILKQLEKNNKLKCNIVIVKKSDTTET